MWECVWNTAGSDKERHMKMQKETEMKQETPRKTKIKKQEEE